MALARLQEGLLADEQCDAAGLLAGRRGTLVRAGSWSRPIHGVYDTEPHVERTWDAARRAQAWTGLLALGRDAIAVGVAALALHDVGGLPTRVVPEVALAGARRGHAHPGVRVRRFDTSAVRVGTARVAPLDQALVQALPELSRLHGVAVVDDVLRRRLLSTVQWDGVRADLAGRRGCRRVRTWWDHVDPRSESPLESFARLQCVDAGVPPDDLQVVVRDAAGRFLGRGDLGWRRSDGRWLLAEVDGHEVHDTPRALLHDRHRQNALVARARVDVLRFTADDIARDRLVPTVRAALGPTWHPPHRP